MKLQILKRSVYYNKMMALPTEIKKMLNFALFAGLALTGFAQENAELVEDDIINLEPFVIFAGEMDVIDGITGKEYNGTNAVVWGFVDTFKEYLVRYHEKLLRFEIQHMNLRTQAGLAIEKQLQELTESFGMRNFKADRKEWLTRERSILYRLNTKPFFRIEALIVWDLDKLNKMLPNRPQTKYAKNIRYNEETQTWERRVLTRWEVYYMFVNEENGNQWPHWVLKQDGLNLDTNKGFHFMESGLSHQVPPSAFKEVEITYPIFYTSKEPAVEQIERLRDTYVSNLYHIYDPFTWIARRNTRFRGGFNRELTEKVRKKRFRVSDRDWFNTVFTHLLNDVAQIKVLGVGEIYELQAINRWKTSENSLGEGLDLLNWHKGENRQGKDITPNAKIWINYENPGGARFIVLDAYMRYADRFLDAVRTRLLDSKRRLSGQDLFKEAIEEVSGIPFDEYSKAAKAAQIRMMENYRD